MGLAGTDAQYGEPGRPRVLATISLKVDWGAAELVSFLQPQPRSSSAYLVSSGVAGPTQRPDEAVRLGPTSSRIRVFGIFRRGNCQALVLRSISMLIASQLICLA